MDIDSAMVVIEINFIPGAVELHMLACMAVVMVNISVCLVTMLLGRTVLKPPAIEQSHCFK